MRTEALAVPGGGERTPSGRPVPAHSALRRVRKVFLNGRLLYAWCATT